MKYLLKSFSILNSLRLSPTEIRKETRKRFRLAVTGTPALAASFCQALAEGMPPLDGVGDGEQKEWNFVVEIPFPVTAEARRELKADGIIFLLSREDAVRENLKNYREIFKLKPPAMLFIEEPQEEEEEKESIYTLLDELGIWGREWIRTPDREELEARAETILGLSGKIDLAMGYRFPALRAAMAKKLIQKTSVQNMILALASSLPANIPIVGIIVGLLGVAGETTVLTINQLKLCLQLAGMYGLEVTLVERIKELWPLVGTAMGLRAAARSLVGFIPLAGPPLKGAIAYAGTQVVGETARWFYEKGRRLTPGERTRIYNEALEKAKDTAGGFLRKLKSTADRKDRAVVGDVDIYRLEEELDSLRKDLEDMEESPEKLRGGREIMKNAMERAGLMDEPIPSPGDGGGEEKAPPGKDGGPEIDEKS